MSEEYGQLRTPPPCCRQGVAAQALRVLVIAIVLPPQASPKRWQRPGEGEVGEQLPFAGGR